MSDKFERDYVTFFVPFSEAKALYSSFSFIDSKCELIDIYRDYVHTDMIVTFAFLGSLSSEQCEEAFRLYTHEFPELGIHHVHKSYPDPES